MSPTRFQSVIEYLLDNLFDILTIGVAGYIVIRHQIAPYDLAQLVSWILAVLGLIAVSGLWDRHRRLNRIEKLSEESRDLVLRRISGKVHAGDFFLSERRVSDPIFSSATKIFLSGMTLTRATREYVHVLGQRLVAGASIRIMILEPTDALLQELVLRSMGETSPDYWRNRIQTVETLVGVIAKTPGSKGKVEFGHLPYIPSFGFTMIDPDQPHGLCFVELYHHKSAEPNPTFELRASDDSYWYPFFRNQFEILWNSCRIESLPQIAEQSTKTN